jgi:ribosomal protein S18 acetylase RimI-like enzyme
MPTAPAAGLAEVRMGHADEVSSRELTGADAARIERERAFSVDDLRADEVAGLTWAGGAIHLRHVAEAVARVEAGEVDYLAVRDADGVPLAIGGVDYTARPDAVTLWQLSTHPDHRSRGLGRRLIAALEQRARARGYTQARLSVERDNVRAHALYQRLGYRVVGSSVERWQTCDEHGHEVTHHADCIELAKPLTAA